MTDPNDIQFAYDTDHDALVYRGPQGRPVAFPIAGLQQFWQKQPPNIGTGPRIVMPGANDFAALRAAHRKGR